MLYPPDEFEATPAEEPFTTIEMPVSGAPWLSETLPVTFWAWEKMEKSNNRENVKSILRHNRWVAGCMCSFIIASCLVKNR
jgi:hypothetical protein